MKKIFYGCLVLFLIGANIAFSQQAVEKVSFFESTVKSATEDYAKDVKAGVILKFDADRVKTFLSKAPRTFEMDLPIGLNGEQVHLKLEKANLFADGFKVVSSLDPDKALDLDLGLHYRGVIEGVGESVVAVSVHDDYISGLIVTPRGNYNLGKLENSEKEHIVYLDRDLNHAFSFECGVEDDDYIYPREMLENNTNSRDAGDCVRIYVEVDDHIVTNAQGVDNATGFAMDLFHEAFTLFAAEGINLVVSEVLVWEVPDPYIGPTSFDYLDQFQANIDEIEGDLGHLLAITGRGGAARLNGLCKSNVDDRLAVSLVENSEVVGVPTYSWNVNVVAHELGHQLGARHTHACAWNTNGTQIDDCGNVWATTNGIDDDMDGTIDEFTEAEGWPCFDPANPILPQNEDKGTIMSYCHLMEDVGVELVFNSQVSTVMRNRVANAVCLNSDCASCALELDCSNMPWQFITCPDEVTPANTNLVIIESSCAWPVDISISELGTATPGDPFIRTYTVTDPTGEVATCVQGFSGSGSTAAVTGAYPNECVLDKFTLSGTYLVCSPLSIVSLEVQFWETGVATGISLPITVNPDGTWGYSNSRSNMVAMGLEMGVWYDLYPFLTLSNGDVILGNEYEFGLDNDIYFSTQSDPQVILNTDPDDSNTAQSTFCYGAPIYYHGTDPLSANHFVSIQRRHINSPGSFTDYRKFGTSGWVGESLNGFAADLQEYFPPNSNFNPEEYFVPGYEYRLQVASSNKAECITWSPTYVEFEVVDCCAPDWELVNVPECVVDGEMASLSVILNAPINPDVIGYVFSANNDYNVIGHEVINHQNRLEVVIYFESNHCTCAGEPFAFNMELVGCNNIVLIETDQIRCCDTGCDFLEVVDWSSGAECIIVNGNPAREFCIEIASDVPVLEVFPESNEASCQVELLDLEITPVGLDGMYEVCGYMVFENFDCDGFGIVTLVFETEAGCCTITQGFSFPEGCNLEEPCVEAEPEIQLVYGNEMMVSLNIPFGEIVSVTDHINGTMEMVNVQTIKCAPFFVNQDGEVSGGVDCNGIEITIPSTLDCYGDDGEIVDLPYHFEINWGNCTWILFGRYCDGLIIVRIIREVGLDGGIEEASTMIETSSGYLRIFPNPLSVSNALNFDASNLNQNIQSIEIRDLQGQKMETIMPENDQKIFSHHFSKPLSSGVYFIIFRLEDGSLTSTKLLMFE